MRLREWQPGKFLPREQQNAPRVSVRLSPSSTGAGASMAGAGLPCGFHEAAAEIFRRPARDGSAGSDEKAVRAVLDALLTSATGRSE